MKHIQPFRLLGLTAALLLASSQGAWAQTDGWYGGVNAGRTAATIDDARISNTLRANGFTSSAIQNDDRSNGFKVLTCTPTSNASNASNATCLPTTLQPTTSATTYSYSPSVSSNSALCITVAAKNGMTDSLASSTKCVSRSGGTYTHY